jgi:hypothetical protein
VSEFKYQATYSLEATASGRTVTHTHSLVFRVE